MSQIRKLRVLFPSGNEVEVEGSWKGVIPAEGTLTPAIELARPVRVNGRMMRRGDLFAGEPRVVVLDQESGKVLYQPRGRFYAALDESWKQLLDENPEWPPEQYRGDV